MNTVQVHYDGLSAIAGRFTRQAEAAAELLASLRRDMQPLAEGGWEGAGAAAFFDEMEGVLLPAVQRLGRAMEAGAAAAVLVGVALGRAEEEAARPFGGRAAGSGEGKQGLWSRVEGWVHGTLDVAGLVPGLGEVADGANALIYLAEGRYLEAGISAAAMIPVVGDLGKAGKWGVRAGKELIEEAGEAGARRMAREGAELLGEAGAKRADDLARRRPWAYKDNFKLSNETAGTGGIKQIRGYRHPDGALEVEIRGELRTGLDRDSPTTPNFNAHGVTSKQAGVPGYDKAHLWGPGFGDEARDGIMFAPAEVNRVWQNAHMENRLRELRDIAREAGGTVELTARARSYPYSIGRGHEILERVSYSFDIRHPSGKVAHVGQVDITVPPPGSTGKPIVDVRPGSAGLWSLK